MPNVHFFLKVKHEHHMIRIYINIIHLLLIYVIFSIKYISYVTVSPQLGLGKVLYKYEVEIFRIAEEKMQSLMEALRKVPGVTLGHFNPR